MRAIRDELADTPQKYWLDLELATSAHGSGSQGERRQRPMTSGFSPRRIKGDG
jgi:hypothetical protein